MEIYSVFDITPRGGTVSQGEAFEGFGEELMLDVRKLYPKYTKFVLKGFEINGNFKNLNMRTHNYIS